MVNLLLPSVEIFIYEILAADHDDVMVMGDRRRMRARRSIRSFVGPPVRPLVRSSAGSLMVSEGDADLYILYIFILLRANDICIYEYSSEKNRSERTNGLRFCHPSVTQQPNHQQIRRNGDLKKLQRRCWRWRSARCAYDAPLNAFLLSPIDRRSAIWRSEALSIRRCEALSIRRSAAVRIPVRPGVRFCRIRLFLSLSLFVAPVR